ncbi:hypothetical protein HHE06_15420 [Helicobacter heilmannii]|uniref:hypothetical protein n=1 Tax=Helicobacter heilmannii TaxID=35817 RepID=UPI0006A18E4D|nr:hypothetical protein [Helicobacter heilmannii]GMB94242.1 hypothetical protein NHP21011_03330 [Helicobacter heilmannii]CRF51654.1 hypothetical protein HHE06_15420 [Helicobacter heilmannii]
MPSTFFKPSQISNRALNPLALVMWSMSNTQSQQVENIAQQGLQDLETIQKQIDEVKVHINENKELIHRLNFS